MDTPPSSKRMLTLTVLSVVLTALLTGGIVYTAQSTQNTQIQTDLQSQINKLRAQVAAIPSATPQTIATTPAPAATATPNAVATASASPAALTECQPSSVSVSLASSGGAAGHYYYNLVVTNTGTQSCTVTSGPTISALNASGTEVGKVTPPTSSSSTALTVKPSEKVYAQIDFPNSGAYATGVCKPIKSLMVYLPNQATGLPIASVDTLNPGFTSTYCPSMSVRAFSAKAS